MSHELVLKFLYAPMPTGDAHVGGDRCHRVLLSIAEHANDATHEAWPSERRIADLLGLHRRDVQNALAALEAQGFITDTGRRKGRGGSRMWRIEVDGDALPVGESEVDGEVDGELDGKVDGDARPEPEPEPDSTTSVLSSNDLRNGEKRRVRSWSDLVDEGTIAAGRPVEVQSHRNTAGMVMEWIAAKHGQAHALDVLADAVQFWASFTSSQRHGPVMEFWAAISEVMHWSRRDYFDKAKIGESLEMQSVEAWWHEVGGRFRLLRTPSGALDDRDYWTAVRDGSLIDRHTDCSVIDFDSMFRMPPS